MSSHSPESHPGTADQTQSLRILLVEDHNDTLEVMRRLLKLAGHEVICATSLADALRQSSDAELDLLISDIGLPDGSGLDLIRQLRQTRPTLPALALTGYGMDDDVRKSHDAGFNAHMTKPINLKQLSLTIAQLVRS